MTDKECEKRIMNNLMYFPAVRLAFEKATRTLDNLTNEAVKENNQDAAKAYRESFRLIREAIKQVEQQGESTLHKHLEDEIEAVFKIAHDNCQKIKYNIEEEYRESLKAVTDGIIKLLQKKNLNDQYISNMTKEIDTYALEAVTEIFSEEGIGFSE